MQVEVTDTEVFEVAGRCGPLIGKVVREIVNKIDISSQVSKKFKVWLLLCENFQMTIVI